MVDPKTGPGHRLGQHRFHRVVGSLQVIACAVRCADVGTEMNPGARSRHEPGTARDEVIKPDVAEFMTA